MTIGPLKLIIKAVNSHQPGGKALCLCTEDGEMVGAQTSTQVNCEADGIGTITVSFHIDGEHIRFADNDG